jgi:hypothetical protein
MYQLVIKVPFEAMDDVEARKKAKEIFNNRLDPLECSFKLQEVYGDKVPRGIAL